MENVKSNRGAVLLGELKALVDSFPEHRRKDVINAFEVVFTRLNADYQSRHSADRQQGGERNPRPSSSTVATADSNKCVSTPKST